MSLKSGLSVNKPSPTAVKMPTHDTEPQIEPTLDHRQQEQFRKKDVIGIVKKENDLQEVEDSVAFTSSSMVGASTVSLGEELLDRSVAEKDMVATYKRELHAVAMNLSRKEMECAEASADLETLKQNMEKMSNACLLYKQKCEQYADSTLNLKRQQATMEEELIEHKMAISDLKKQLQQQTNHVNEARKLQSESEWEHALADAQLLVKTLEEEKIEKDRKLDTVHRICGTLQLQVKSFEAKERQWAAAQLSHESMQKKLQGTIERLENQRMEEVEECQRRIAVTATRNSQHSDNAADGETRGAGQQDEARWLEKVHEMLEKEREKQDQERVALITRHEAVIVSLDAQLSQMQEKVLSQEVEKSHLVAAQAQLKHEKNALENDIEFYKAKESQWIEHTAKADENIRALEQAIQVGTEAFKASEKSVLEWKEKFCDVEARLAREQAVMESFVLERGQVDEKLVREMAENKRLVAIEADRTNEIEAMKCELATAKARVHALEEELQWHTREAETEKKQTDQVIREWQRQVEEANSVKQKCSTLERQAVSQDAIIESWTHQVAILEEKLVVAEAEKEKLRTTVQALEENVQRLTRQEKTYQAETVEKLSVSESNAQRLEAHVALLKDELSAQSDLAAKVTLDYNSLKSQVATHEAVIASFKLQLCDAEEQVSKAVADKEIQQESAKALETTIQALQEHIKEQGVTCETLKAENAQKVVSLEAKIDELQKNLHMVREQLQIQLATVDTLTKRCAEYEAKATSHVSVVESYIAEVAELKAQLAQQQSLELSLQAEANQAMTRFTDQVVSTTDQKTAAVEAQRHHPHSDNRGKDHEEQQHKHREDSLKIARFETQVKDLEARYREACIKIKTLENLEKKDQPHASTNDVPTRFRVSPLSSSSPSIANDPKRSITTFDNDETTLMKDEHFHISRFPTSTVSVVGKGVVVIHSGGTHMEAGLLMENMQTFVPLVKIPVRLTIDLHMSNHL